MKTTAIVMVALLLTMAPVFAQEADLPDPGVTPGSVLYGLDKALERIELALSRGSERKAQVHLKHANERLAEIKVLSEEGDTTHIDEAEEGFEADIENAAAEIENAKGIGANVSALVKEVEYSWDKHVMVLTLVLEKVPDQAKEAIQRNIDRAIVKNEWRRTRIGNIASGDAKNEWRQTKIAAKEERKQGFVLGNISEGKPEHAGKPETAGKPEDVGKPEDDGESEATGQPEDPGKPESPGKPEDVGKPEGAGKPS
jgi:hypothetical protein